jgi:hypothetical protein
MSKHFAALPFVLTAVAVSLSASPVLAGKKVKPEEMTCEEFLALDEGAQAYVVSWMEGKSGELDTVDIDEYSAPVTYVVAECKAAREETAWQKIKHWFATHNAEDMAVKHLEREKK